MRIVGTVHLCVKLRVEKEDEGRRGMLDLALRSFFIFFLSRLSLQGERNVR